MINTPTFEQERETAEQVVYWLTRENKPFADYICGVLWVIKGAESRNIYDPLSVYLPTFYEKYYEKCRLYAATHEGLWFESTVERINALKECYQL